LTDTLPAAHHRPPRRIVVMGVCGCGKSTIGRALAEALRLPYVEGDGLHPTRNVALMAAGTPLTDDDRQGWLQAVAGVLASAAGTGVVVSCSALKRVYRDLLRGAVGDIVFVHLTGTPVLLAQRLQGRGGHYMPPALLPSQLAILEPPADDERAITLDIAAEPAAIVASTCLQLETAFP
jgi:carbohydrate kinase (thermoresistant glucokinase family)